MSISIKSRLLRIQADLTVLNYEVETDSQVEDVVFMREKAAKLLKSICESSVASPEMLESMRLAGV